MLQEFLCGPCAQASQLSLDAQIALALSLKKRHQYVCNLCSQIFQLQVYNVRDSGTGDSADAVVITDVQELRTITDGNQEIKKKENKKDAEQLELF